MTCHSFYSVYLFILLFCLISITKAGKKEELSDIGRSDTDASTSIRSNPLYVCDNSTPEKFLNRGKDAQRFVTIEDDKEGDKCYFHKERISPLEKQDRSVQSKVSCTCSGSLISMKTIMDSSDSYKNLYEAANPLSLTLCRGAGKCDLDFDDPSVVMEWSRRSICEGHKNELLDKWHHINYYHIFRRHWKQGKKPACSVSGVLGFNHDSPKPPFINPRTVFELNQNEADALLKNNHVLLHPGIPLCPHHKKYAKDALSQRRAQERGYILSPPPEENGLMSDSDDVDDESNHMGRMEYKDPNYVVRQTPLSKDRYVVPAHIQKAFYQFAQAADQSRFISYKPFSDLQPDTKRKKSLMLRYLLKVMSQILAPDSPDELKNMALGEDARNMWHISSDHDLSRILEYTSGLYYNTESRTERLHLLSIFSPLLSLSHLQQYIPGISKVMYYQSKKLSKMELVQVNHRREKYDPAKVHYFVEFITSNAVTSSHVVGVQKGKLSDGSLMELSNTIRKQGATEIIEMYKRYLKENQMDKYKMSDSTYFRILNACPATKQTASVCVDYFLADMLEAQEKIRDVLKKWHENGRIPKAYQNQLIRGIEESVNYFRTDYRIHLSSSSHTADHCMIHSLSDSLKEEFQTKCDHEHSVKCDRCEMVKNVEGEILDYADSLVKKCGNEDNCVIDQQREDYGVIKDSLKKMLEYKRHVLRSEFTDNDRSHIIEHLEEDEAMITLDFAQKMLPQKFHETQLDYFGKRGMSYHVSHIIANVSESLVTHAFVHVLKDGQQDNQIVTALLTHILSEIGSLGIKNVVLRSDNAGCYHSAKTMFSLSAISEKTGVNIRRYSFSEPQNGKGSCDRVASQIKRQVREHVDRGNDVTTSEAFFEALKVRPLNGVSYYLADLADREDTKKTTVSITGMSGLYDFTVETMFLIARRYHGIGNGIKIKVNSNLANKASLEIISSGGFTARETNSMKEKSSIIGVSSYRSPLPSFWKLGYSVQKTYLPIKIYKENVIHEDEHNFREEQTSSRTFRCPIPGCSARFLYHGSLVHHLDRGKHNCAPERKTLRDEALHSFRLHLEDLIVPVTTRIEVIRKALTTLRHHKNDQLLNLPTGWALRTRAKQGRFSNSVHSWLKSIFEEGLTGRKKNGKETEQLMKTAVNEDGNVMFSIEERLNWRQIQSVFSQLTRKQSESTNRDKRSIDDNIDDDMENEYSFHFEDLYLIDPAPTLAEIIWMEIKNNPSIFLGKDEEADQEEIDDNVSHTTLSRRRTTTQSPATSTPFKRWRDELFK